MTAYGNELALFGGNALVSNHAKLRIPWPIVSEDDRQAVLATFERYDFSGRGSEEIYALENEMARYLSMPFGTALNSGTAAIHAALVSLGIREGDEVIVPNLTFVATAMAVVHNRSIPVFADIDPHTYNISPESIVRNITGRTRAVIAVHMHGTPANIVEIKNICESHGLRLIEDVAQAPGASIDGKLVGSFGDASILSLMSQKNLATCGEGGILLSRTMEEKNRAEMLRIYGEIIKRDSPRAYNSFTLGWNYTMNPIQAAMARSQLARFPELTKKIQASGRKLNEKLAGFSWINPPHELTEAGNVFHFYRFRLNPLAIGYPKTGRFRKAIQDAMQAEGLHLRHYLNAPVSEQPVFKNDPAYSLRSPLSLYPNTLDVLNSTLVLGAISSSPGYLLCEGTIDRYAEGFSKIQRNIEKVIQYAERIEYREPWEEIAKTSDSYGAKYECLTA